MFAGIIFSVSVAAAIGAWLPADAVLAATPEGSRLYFGAEAGAAADYFLREDNVAVHVVLRGGTRPRILLAFPAGNSGVGLWFSDAGRGSRWLLRAPVRPVHGKDAGGRTLQGASAQLTLALPELRVRAAVLSSIRILRDYELRGTVPSAITAVPRREGRTISWTRNRLDGAPGYRLTVEVTDGELRDGSIHAGADGRIGLTVTGLTGEPPLTPLAGRELLRDPVVSDPTARDTLTFLAYREKWLAGSWRFDTYFGRDTLLTVRLLMPALSPTAIESALTSVLARVSPLGEVAHEEDVGERAVLDHLQRDGSYSASPVYDYKMIDANYLLAPVADLWLLRDPRARARAASFLATPGAAADGKSMVRGAALMRNLRLVLQTATPFAMRPQALRLIALKRGHAVGNWRDSDDGLGGGRYPFDVNAVLVPAALEAAAQLHASGLLSPYLRAGDAALLGRAAAMARLWRTRAPPLFDVTITSGQAKQAIARYAASLSLAPQPALASLASGSVRFHAIALDPAGRPVPVLHSDEGFALLFTNCDAQQVDRAVTNVMRPFPAGLMTPVGMVVANPVFATPSLQARFSRNAYHGTVVWSWQQALLAAGLARQLQRRDLPATVRQRLVQAQRALWRAIGSTRAVSNSELWSWSFAGGSYRLEPFGADVADVDESNAAQLWSTVYLAVRPPPAAH